MTSPVLPDDQRMAIDPDGKVKPVSEFSADERWWCDGEDCGEEGQPPHVHCMMHRHLVDLVTGRSIDFDVALAEERARKPAQ